MSEFDRYKELYNKFVVLLTDLHNTNVSYVRAPSYRNGMTLRKILRQLRVVEKELWSASVKASAEVSKIKGRGRPKKEK